MAFAATASYWPWNDRQGRFSALRAGCFALVLVPALILAWQAWAHQLGSKPWTQAVHDTGEYLKAQINAVKLVPWGARTAVNGVLTGMFSLLENMTSGGIADPDTAI